MLKENLAETGDGGVITRENKCYNSRKIPFLRLYDTIGIEMKKQYNSNTIYNNAKLVIDNSQNKENFNDFVQCIWYCFRSDYIEEAENSARKSDRIIIISDAQMEKFHKLFPFAKDNIVLAVLFFNVIIFATPSSFLFGDS